MILPTQQGEWRLTSSDPGSLEATEGEGDPPSPLRGFLEEAAHQLGKAGEARTPSPGNQTMWDS